MSIFTVHHVHDDRAFLFTFLQLEATVEVKTFIFLCWEQDKEQKGILRSALNQMQFWVIQSGFNREHKSHIP